MARAVQIRRHAIFKRHYRRAVASTPGFHELDLSAQWGLLRDQILVDRSEDSARLLEIFHSRDPRRAEVISELEQARQEQAG
jgi:hypothetical protein